MKALRKRIITKFFGDRCAIVVGPRGTRTAINLNYDLQGWARRCIEPERACLRRDLSALHNLRTAIDKGATA